MKKIFLLIVIGFISCNSFAQQKKDFTFYVKKPKNTVAEATVIAGQKPRFTENDTALITEAGVLTEEFLVVEQMPTFPGGESAFFQYLRKEIKYPLVEGIRINGSVYTSFIVESDGSISNAKIIKGIHPLFDAEALRVINSMPKWMPGYQSGKAVRTQYSLPIQFNVR